MIQRAIASKPAIPPLENGDRLTQAEFERRYDAMPDVKKAELIEGIVYMASPLRIKRQVEPHAAAIGWLFLYNAATPGVGLADNTTVRLDADNELQPDALLRVEVGGRSTISQDDYLEGAPELIMEIAASSISIDSHDKLKVYRRNQVQEYLIWRVEDGELDWFCLKQGKYIQVQPSSDGIIRSEVFPGLWLERDALLLGNLPKLIEIARQGLATTEHQDFIQQLSEKSNS